jgi:hypothetical protein
VRAPAELAIPISLLAFAAHAPAEVAEPGEPPVAPAQPVAAEGPHAHLFGALAIGRGIRFNNPYRLATPLGDSAESLSLTATYLDLSAGATSGPRDGIGHGGVLHLAVALDGIPQEVLTPAYVALHRFAGGFLIYGRAGTPVVLEPDLNLGFELAGGGAWLLTAGLGLTAELSGSLFYGAATHDRAITVIPIVALSVGVFMDYEILP